MHPDVESCFFEDDIPGDLVFDMVYNPLETTLLKRAREQSREVVPGIEMFLEQAAAQFELFTGESAPKPAMHKAALEALGASAT
jgi:3-dehydroquinate dehydratase/shikimate dehydrogenase